MLSPLSRTEPHDVVIRSRSVEKSRIETPRGQAKIKQPRKCAPVSLLPAGQWRTAGWARPGPEPTPRPGRVCPLRVSRVTPRDPIFLPHNSELRDSCRCEDRWWQTG
ncbi:hypothetical protein AAFF_G00252270 [Aldrovandia affinis]|uniref:Uncharacterized protein n=1 Tax=Aldrovandia affinis TaxID=143900 RepID=A0AAD7SUU8_9TELE|nr:hypothetical protein AAFF_G00252270 [Aldrovandia affinis]